MAVYKVPQDVEAEDKLVGWLTFRQFIYAGIAAASGVVGFFLFQVSPVLVAIPLPFILLFGILTLPLRKDQPMETYLLAVLRFYLKPKLRMWNSDGTITYVEITAPKMIEQHLAKEFSGETAKEKLDYLARVMDSRGWSLKGVDRPGENMVQDVAAEAQTAVDVLDEDAALSRSFDDLIAKKDQERRAAAVAQMTAAATAPKASATPLTTPPADDDQQTEDTILTPQFNPYPSSMHQKIVHPLGDSQGQQTPQVAQKAVKDDDDTAKKKKAKKATSAMTPAVSPDIIRLAGNEDLSISAIAHEAHRLEAKENEEVVIKLH